MAVEAALKTFRTEHTLDTSLMDILPFTGQLLKEYCTIQDFPLFGDVLNQSASYKFLLGISLK